jgi:carbon starvation protein CstA
LEESARNITIATGIAVLVPMGLALYPSDAGGESGFAFGYLWRLFGTTNQLTAGLALAVVAVWVFTRGRNPLAQIIPLVFLLTMTVWALFIQIGEFYAGGGLAPHHRRRPHLRAGPVADSGGHRRLPAREGRACGGPHRRGGVSRCCTG